MTARSLLGALACMLALAGCDALTADVPTPSFEARLEGARTTRLAGDVRLEASDLDAYDGRYDLRDDLAPDGLFLIHLLDLRSPDLPRQITFTFRSADLAPGSYSFCDPHRAVATDAGCVRAVYTERVADGRINLEPEGGTLTVERDGNVLTGTFRMETSFYRRLPASPQGPGTVSYAPEASRVNEAVRVEGRFTAVDEIPSIADVSGRR